ncbi:MAG: GAF domain-containing sensor histidine kinase [Chloroflexi bacterium]|nr:GAF domain-containing sensor histidine kinase [Chloroflexota bacterium]
METLASNRIQATGFFNPTCLFSTMTLKNSNEARIQDAIHRLTRVIEVSCALSSIDIDVLLKRVVDAAVELTNAEMGGLLVLDENTEQFEYFKVSGWPYEPKGFPSGKGILGIPYREGDILLERNIHEHAKAVGVPEGHPDIKAFLAVPLKIRTKLLGSLFVGNEDSDKIFSEEDKHLLVAFATQVAVVIENARLYNRSEKLAILEERNRIARSLHETVVQYLFTIGLETERCLGRSEECDQHLTKIRRLSERASDELRSAIFTLSTISHTNPKGLSAILVDLIKEFEQNSGIKTTLLTPDTLPNVPATVNDAVYRIVREALFNIQKHAQAMAAVVTLSADKDELTVVIQDNGRGLDAENVDGLHFGLLTMREVTAHARGELSITNNEDDIGTIVRAVFPLKEENGL